MIYLDSAATTLQKPPSVVWAASYAIGHMASPGRGGHRPAMRAAETAYACREAAATLFEVDNPEHVVLTFNATHGINIAIRSLVHPQDTVLISGYEHNAVTRPLTALGATIKVATSPLFEPEIMLRQFEEKLTPEVSCVICTHVSNVFGYVLPVEKIAALCTARRVPLVLDASQSAGCLPLSLTKLGAAFIAMPGHKGLYGPQGTGLLLCNAETVPVLMGGTGSASAQQEMPAFLPDRLEAGTHNITGVAGLLEGIRFVLQRTPETILAHERKLTERVIAGCIGKPGIHLYASPQLFAQTGVLSFRLDGGDCETVASALARRGIAVRAGLHCAPLAHQSADTFATGTVRASFSAFNTAREAERFVWEITMLAGKKYIQKQGNGQS